VSSIRRLENLSVASWQRVISHLAWLLTARYDKRLRSFRRSLIGGSATGVRAQPFRGLDIILQLRRHAPRSICELGSGASTGVFASYVERHRGRHVAFEHDERWRQVTLQALKASGLDHGDLEVIQSDARATARGVGYTAPIPDDVDFVYVDGPPAKDETGRRFACVDILEALDRGARPGTIMVDGREQTVSALLMHPAVQGEYEVDFQRGSGRSGLPAWRESLRFRPHHIFTLRNGGVRA
jgi:predicted O-methyltransferase YrrM